jgi:hypothetical protein
MFAARPPERQQIRLFEKVRYVRAVRLLVPVIALLTLATGACANGGPTSSPSRTPKITVASGTALDAALLSTDDLHSIAGLPSDVKAVALNGLNVFEDPDPRAPCGAKVTPLDLSRGAGVGIQSSTIQGAQLVVQLDEGAATRQVDAFIADAHDGCAAFQSVTNRGATQTVTLDHVVTLPALADQAAAATSIIESSGTSVVATHLVVRRAATLAVTVLFSARKLGDDVVRALAARVAGRLG